VAEGLPEDGDRWADELLDRLTPVMSALSIVFLLIVIGESMADENTTLSLALTVAGWLIWLVFAAEFVARMVLAPDTGAFLKRNWWQVLFLILPFLRIFRLVRVMRVVRTGRVLSSGIRSSRSASRMLGSRVGWLGLVSAITVLGSSQLLYEFGVFDRYGDALHAAAMAAITGEPLARPDGFAKILEVALAGSPWLFLRAWPGPSAPFSWSPGSRERTCSRCQMAGTNKLMPTTSRELPMRIFNGEKTVLSAQRSLSQATPTCSRRHPWKYLSAGLSPQAALSGEALGECRPEPRGLTRRRVFWAAAALGPTRKTSCSISGLVAAEVAATKVL
jgi:voltage-gated potassium channel